MTISLNRELLRVLAKLEKIVLYDLLLFVDQERWALGEITYGNVTRSDDISQGIRVTFLPVLRADSP